MHERSLVKALLRQVEDLAAAHPGSHIVSIRVHIGEFSGVEPELFATAYDDLVNETPLHGAALSLQRVPLEAVCDQCGLRFRIERFNFQCGKCGSLKLSINGGEEMLLESVIIEESSK
jgi:hydrogenase nickel incorporation protein HypA/HybF